MSLGEKLVYEDDVSCKFVMKFFSMKRKLKERFYGKKTRCMHIVPATSLNLKASIVVMYCLS